MPFRELPDWKEVKIPGIGKLSAYLRDRVIGQERAIGQVVRAFNMARADLLPSWRPLAVLSFPGPTGVGKTELAIALADYLYMRENKKGRTYPEPPLVQVDCGLFGGSSEFAITELIGSPAGYVGSRGVEGDGKKPALIQENFLPDRITVLLFDEIEKAFQVDNPFHSGQEMLGLLVTMLDKGRLKNRWDDGFVNFRNAVVIFTSNIGAREIAKAGRGGIEAVFGQHFQYRAVRELDKRADNDESLGNRLSDEEIESLNEDIYKTTKREWNKAFPPEMRNRVDRLVVFRFLSRKDFSEILDKKLIGLGNQIGDKHSVSLFVSDEVREWFLSHGVVREDGVPSLQRAILRKIVNPISTYLNAGMLGSGDALHVEVGGSVEREAKFLFFKE